MTLPPFIPPLPISSPPNTRLYYKLVTMAELDELDAFGIPVNVRHAPQTALAVWQYVHQLAEPLADPRRPASPYTHVCVLCAEELHRDRALGAPATWRKALMRQRMSTNALKHMERRHPGVPCEGRGRSNTAAALKRNAPNDPTAPPAKRGRKPNRSRLQPQQQPKDEVLVPAFDPTAPVEAVGRPNKPAVASRPAAAALSTEQLHFLLNRWLISAGLPHEATENVELRHLLASASRTPTLELSSRAAFDTHLEMEFAQFALGVAQFLKAEWDAAAGRPFLSARAESCGTASGADVWTLSVSLVDSQWRQVSLVLVGQPVISPSTGDDDGSGSPTRKMVRDKLTDTYGLELEAFQKFSVLDRVDAPFVKTGQADDLLHLVTASVLAALGLVDGALYPPADGAIREIERVLERLLQLFQDPARKSKLFQIGEFYHAQLALGDVESPTRLGYMCELLRRSCRNFSTYSRFFATAPGDEDMQLWTQLSPDDWMTIVELEAVLSQLSTQFDLDVRHPRRVSSSYAFFFRRLLDVTLNAKTFKCLPLDGSSHADELGARESRPAESFTTTTREFLMRARQQIDERFPAAAQPSEIKAMLLDPRVKSKVDSLIGDAVAVATAKQELRQEHHSIFMTLAERELAAKGTVDEVGAQHAQEAADDDPTDSDEDEMSALLAMDGPSKAAKQPLVSVSNGSGPSTGGSGPGAAATRALELEQAEQEAWDRWQELVVEWEHFASSDAIFLKNGQYNVAKLYQHVDVLQWFKKSGANLYPAVAVLARMYLGRPFASVSHNQFVDELTDWDFALRTPSDVARAEKLRLMKQNWSQWKELSADGGRDRRGNKRAAII